jgi:2-polyprenyl-3-methyl-5-hydroxy-6-metoxy-1,4-benzoquinol methylase
MNEVEIFRHLVSASKSDPIFKTEIPEAVSENIGNARQLVENIEKHITSHYADYFKISKERYSNYISAAKSYLPNNSNILDVGNAPGHVAMCLHELGFDITGINLNAEWRKTYPDQKWVEIFSVVECDIENSKLPFADDRFDGILFTEVLEHIAITDPRKILEEFRRVLKPEGIIIFSTPNVCNISNIYALLHGMNVFWSPDIFYGSLDRHNREYTPTEVVHCFRQAGFEIVEMWGINDHGNWRNGGNEFAYDFLSKHGDDSSLLRNTIVGVFKK